jgi:glycosyltransferase involved in cell wall biosynthesis
MTHNARYVADGRFLAAAPTGLHRVARSFALAAKRAGVDVEVWAPRGTTDPLADRVIRAPGGRVGGRIWEQLMLPASTRGRTIWSLTNTAPLLSPGVVVVHDLAATVGPEWFARSMRAYAAAVRRSARHARHVIAVSDAVRRELVELGLDQRKVSVVSPAIDSRFAPASHEAVVDVRERHALDLPYALFVGWADPRKDVATAVAAHQAVGRDIPHDLVLVGGTHPTFAPVTVPAAPTVRQLGRIADDELVTLLTGAAVLLYPSRYEGYGLPPLEAMACGTPAVVSDIPALRESTAGTARLAPVGDASAWAEALRVGLEGGLSCPSRPPSPSPQEVGQRLAETLSGGSAP